MLGPYLLGALQPDEEEAVEEHLARCPTCREEERGLREIHEQLAGASVAASSVPPDLKERLFAELPPREGSEAPSERTTRNASRFAWWGGLAGAAVLLLVALGAVAYSAGFFDRPEAMATLTSTELAPGAGGKLEVRDSGPNAEASLEVWGLPQNGPDEYYELWLGRDGGRVSCGTFTVDSEGRGRIYASAPYASALEEGGYQRVGITLEKFPEEPRMSSAQVVLRGDLQET
jgi:anti-sigma-K factor RskA